MTTLAEARTELVTLLGELSDAKSDAPAALVFGNGIDLADRGHVTRGQVPASFRIVVLGGVWDDADVPGGELADALAGVLTALRAIAWAITDVRPDRVIAVGGSKYLAAEVVASRMIDL